MTPRVEPMSLAAAGLVAVLHRACFPEDPCDAGAIEQIARIPGFFGCIGWADYDLAGFAFALDLGGESELLSLGVMPDHRRAGMGSALLASICDEARRRGAASVVLEVAVGNDAAWALYAARGFTVVGRRPNYYQQAGRSVDALILRIELGTAAMAT